MKINWILQEDIFNEGNPERMAEIIRQRGMECRFVGYESMYGGKFKHFADDECVIAYGSLNLIKFLLQKTPWTPTAWFNLQNQSCAGYYSRWGKYLLQQNYTFIPWAELKRKVNSVYSHYGNNDCIFIRPNQNSKLFTGCVVNKNDFHEWFEENQRCYTPDQDCFVVVSEPQNITHEWRFVVCEKEILTGSLYKNNWMFGEDAELYNDAIALAKEIAASDWQPDPMYVLDICRTTDGKLSLLEIGSWNTAGLYKCDLEICIDRATKLAEKQWQELV